MTRLAAGAGRSFVHVILSVAGKTLPIHFFLIQISSVAAIAGNDAMAPDKIIIRIGIMIEVDFSPALCRVTSLAIRSEASLVFVVLFVARHTFSGDVLEVATRMATGALRPHMCAGQWKLSPAVVEGNCPPSGAYYCISPARPGRSGASTDWLHRQGQSSCFVLRRQDSLR